MKKNIVLIGFMGSGKTSVGKELAKSLNLKFVDLDTMIEAEEKRPISQIFSQDGEAYFRRIEKEMVRKVCPDRGLVIACGGGVVLDTENMQNLKQHGTLVYLKASPEVIFKRTEGYKHRPLLIVSDPKKRIEELLTLREPLYAQSDYTIDTTHLNIAQVTEQILKIFKK